MYKPTGMTDDQFTDYINEKSVALNRSMQINSEVMQERGRQYDKWGPQVHPDGTGGQLAAENAALAKADTDQAAADGTLTYAQILEEEVCEVLAETDPNALRAELIQVAAVAVAWVDKIDQEQL